MKKYLLYISIVLSSVATQAQVGIGTKSPSKKAALHIDGDNKRGLIVPAVDTVADVDIEAIANDADKAKRAAGILVYQRADSAFYFWNMDRWQCINPFETISSSGEITPSAPYTKVVGDFEGTANLNGDFNGNITGNVVGNLNASGTNTFSGNGTIPIGGIIMWSGTAAPTGWALCDGSNGTPDLRGRFVVGYEPYTKYSNPGKLSTGGSIAGSTGGNETIKITEQNLPAHKHQMSSDGATVSISGGSHTHDVADVSANRGGDGRVAVRGENWDETYDYIAKANTHTHPTSEFSGNTGNGVNCNNTDLIILPPYYVLAYIMRIQ